MKPKLLFSLLTVLIVLLAGCATYEPQAKPGIYRSNSTTDFIILSTNTMLIHIEGMDARDKTGKGLAFEYVEWSDGRILPVVSRSGELLYGYPSLEYQWEEGQIMATNSRSQTSWRFENRKNKQVLS